MRKGIDRVIFVLLLVCLVSFGAIGCGEIGKKPVKQPVVSVIYEIKEYKGLLLELSQVIEIKENLDSKLICHGTVTSDDLIIKDRKPDDFFYISKEISEDELDKYENNPDFTVDMIFTEIENTDDPFADKELEERYIVSRVNKYVETLLTDKIITPEDSKLFACNSRELFNSSNLHIESDEDIDAAYIAIKTSKSFAYGKVLFSYPSSVEQINGFVLTNEHPLFDQSVGSILYQDSNGVRIIHEFDKENGGYRIIKSEKVDETDLYRYMSFK